MYGGPGIDYFSKNLRKWLTNSAVTNSRNQRQ